MFRSTSIEADLDLKRHGLKQIIADPFHVHLDPEGPSLAFWKDPARTAEELAYFSRRTLALTWSSPTASTRRWIWSCRT